MIKKAAIYGLVIIPAMVIVVSAAAVIATIGAVSDELYGRAR